MQIRLKNRGLFVGMLQSSVRIFLQVISKPRFLHLYNLYNKITKK